jgi:hypothetical protein
MQIMKIGHGFTRVKSGGNVFGRVKRFDITDITDVTERGQYVVKV